MAMARDGLLPPFFSDINQRSQVPVKSTIVTGLVAALLAFSMEVSELAGMVTLLFQHLEFPYCFCLDYKLQCCSKLTPFKSLCGISSSYPNSKL